MDGERYPDTRPEVVVHHKRKVPFDPQIPVDPELRDEILEIHSLDRELGEFILTAEDHLDLVFEEAWPVNFHRSTALEGNPLGIDEVREITRNTAHGETEQHVDFPMQEIYNHLSFWVTPDLLETPWDLDTIRQVHRRLLMGADEGVRPGEFREEGRASVCNDAGDEVFVGAPGTHIEEEMEALLTWLNERGGAYFPLITATVFCHEFESIHPFVDGNGRTGRVLFHGYLQNHGLPHSHLCTIEKQITENPRTYYNVLAWTDHEEDYELLLNYFTEATLTSYRNAVERFRSKDLLSGDMDEVKKRLLIKARREGGWFSSTEASDWISGRSQDTVRRHLNDLTDMDLLETKGQTRAKRYTFSNPLSVLIDEAKRTLEDMQTDNLQGLASIEDRDDRS
jgi:Fic family protein